MSTLRVDNIVPFSSGSTTITLAGTLDATASYAENSISSSYALTASYALNGESTDTGSLLVTASATDNVITFTKGDSTTFDITVDTGSAVTTDTGSLLVTASVSSNTITFTKGDTTTFDITIDTGSAAITDTGSLITTASVSFNTVTFTKGDATTFDITIDTGSAVTTDTGSLLITASVSINTITFIKGDATTFDITVDTGSVDLSGYVSSSTFNSFTSSYNTGSFSGSLEGTATTASYVENAISSSFASTASYVENAQSASYYIETDPVFTAISGTLATTGSNTFNGTQTVSGSIEISGSIIPSTDGVSTTSSFSLGSATNAWKDIWVSNGTINFLDGAGNVQAALTSNDQGLQIENYTAVTGSVPVFNISGSGNITNGLTVTGSLAQGDSVIATGSFSHAEGVQTEAIGNASHAEGTNTQAIGDYSHAEGYHTIASGSYQHVSGQYNQHNNDTSYFVVGIGLTEETRKDGFTVDVDANGSGSVMIPSNIDFPSNPKTGSMFINTAPGNIALWVYLGSGGINGWYYSSLLGA